MNKEKTKEALRALERILSYTNGLGDGEAYTIRATLTEATDVNAEMLEALDVATKELEEHSKCEDCQVGVPLNTLNKCHGAIARAEAQKVGA